MIDPNVISFTPEGDPRTSPPPLLMSPAINIMVGGGALSGPPSEERGLLRPLWKEATDGLCSLLKERHYVSFVACTEPGRQAVPDPYSVGIECEAIVLWRQAEGVDAPVNWVEYAIEQGYSVYIRDRGDAPEPYHTRYLTAQERAKRNGRGVWRLETAAPVLFAQLSRSPSFSPVVHDLMGLPQAPPGGGLPGISSARRPSTSEAIRMENGATMRSKIQVQVLTDAEVHRVAEAMRVASADRALTASEVASFFGEGSTVECSPDALQKLQTFLAAKAREGIAGLAGRESVEVVQEEVLRVLGGGVLPAVQDSRARDGN